MLIKRQRLLQILYDINPLKHTGTTFLYKELLRADSDAGKKGQRADRVTSRVNRDDDVEKPCCFGHQTTASQLV